MKIFKDFSELPGAGKGSEIGKGVTFNTLLAEQTRDIVTDVPASDNVVLNMGWVMGVSGYDIVVYSRNEHLPSHVHIEKDNKELGKISLYPTVEIIDPKTTRIPEGVQSKLVETVKLNRKKCQREWNRINGKPEPDPRRASAEHAEE